VKLKKKSTKRILSLTMALLMTSITLLPIWVQADSTYTATVGTITNGSLTLSVTTGDTAHVAFGDIVSVTVTSDAGKKLKAGSLRYTPEGGTATTIADGGSGYSFSMPAANVTVTAQFENDEEASAPTYTATVDTTTGGSLQYIPEGGAATTIADSGSGHSFSMPAANVTVTAQFKDDGVALAPTYTATVDTTTGGSLALSVTMGDTAHVTSGYIVTVTVNPDAGEKLKAGSLQYTPEGGGAAVQIPVTDNTGSFLMPAANVLVTARFVTQGTIATGTSTVFSISTHTPNLTVGDSFTMTAAVTSTSGGAYGFEGGFAITSSGSVLNPGPLQLDTEKFAADNAGIPGITVDTTTTPGYISVYVESDGQTLKIPEGVTTIKFPFKVVNTQASAATHLELTDGGSASGICKWILLTNPVTRVRATGTGLTTLNFNQTDIDAALGLGYAVYDAGIHNLDAFSIAFAANAAFTLDKTQATVGDTVTATATVSSTVDAYGFTGAIVFSAANLMLDTSATAAANPMLALTFIGNNGSNRIICQSTDKVIAANTPLALVLKFKVTNTTTDNLTVDFGIGASRLLLFKNVTVTPADVATAAQITAQESAGAIAIVQSTASPVLTTIQATTVTLAADGTDSGKIGDTLTVKATINSTVDAYGFMGSFKYPYSAGTPHGQIIPDLTATQAVNRTINGLKVDTSTGGYVRFTCDPAGQTKVIAAGTPFTLILKFKVVSTADSTITNLAVNIGTASRRLVLFTDPGVTCASLNSNNNINAAEKARKVEIVNLSGFAANLHTLFDAGVVFDTPAANVGGNEQPVTVTAKITAPVDKDVYGFETAIVYQGNKNIKTDLQLNPTAITAANAGILSEKVQVGTVPNATIPNSSAWSYAVPIWVESDGTTPIIQKGETLELKLVFKTLPFNGEGTLAVNAGTAGGRFVLFTDPSIRAKVTGAGLTAINFDNDAILTQEGLGTIAIAGTTGGSIILTRAITGLTMSSGSYDLSTPTDVLMFADSVNTLGYTSINATVKNDIDMTGTAFSGIGTKEHPFTGTISSMKKTIKIARVVTEGSSAVGGLVNYLGSGGKISGVMTTGTITGDFGGASVGGLVGVSECGHISPPITVSVSISGTASDGANVGGIAGSQNCGSNNYGLTIYNGNISVTAARGSTVNVGGIVGTFDGTSQTTDIDRMLYMCFNTGNISGGSNTGSIAGSIKNGIIKKSGNGVCTNNTAPYGGGGTVTGSGNTGGVAGHATDTTLTNVCNTGVVTGSGTSTGGIVGCVEGSGTRVEQSYNTASVTGSGTVVGGIIGENASADTAVTSDFNLGNVTATDSEVNAGAIVGKATAASVVYQGNYYLKNCSVNSGIGDALDNTAFTVGSGNENAVSASNPGSFSLTGASNETPGIYQYQSQPPLTDAGGIYLLSTVGDIVWFAQTVKTNTESGTQNQINGRLVSNIDMSKVPLARFSGIGAGDGYMAYAGTFDGAGFTVTVRNSPLFDKCIGAMIKNLTVDGSLSGTAIGGIVNMIKDGLIENCHNKADINSTDGLIGGIVYQAMNSTISGCTNSGNITGGQGGSIGGIVAILGGFEMEKSPGSNVYSIVKPTHSVVINCTNSGDITGGRTIGGICGLTSGQNCTAEFINCTNTGKVTSTAMTSAINSIYNPDYVNSAGGILGGAIDITVNIESCTNSGTVTGTANNLGGIVGVATPSWGVYGDTSIKITNSTNSGKVISTVDPNAMDTSYGSNRVTPDNIYVGGIMGNAMMGIVALGISGNTNTAGVDKGIAAHASEILGSGNHDGIGANKTSSDNAPPSDSGNDPDTPAPQKSAVIAVDNSRSATENPSGICPSAAQNPVRATENPSGISTAAAQKPVPATENPSGISTATAQNPAPAPENPAEKSAANPAPEQNNNSPADSGKPATEPGSTTGVNLKDASVFEIVRDTVNNNPVAAVATGVIAIVLVVVGGYWRFIRIHSSR
jgi:hypothetical protein